MSERYHPKLVSKAGETAPRVPENIEQTPDAKLFVAPSHSVWARCLLKALYALIAYRCRTGTVMVKGGKKAGTHRWA